MIVNRRFLKGRTFLLIGIVNFLPPPLQLAPVTRPPKEMCNRLTSLVRIDIHIKKNKKQ